MIKISNLGKTILFAVCLILSIIALFSALSFIFTGTFTPGLTPDNRVSHTFSQDELYRELKDFELLEHGVIRSVSNDPWIVLRTNPLFAGDMLTINISGLSIDGAMAQVFFAYGNDYFSEANSVRFVLTNGANVVSLPNTTYSTLRLDLTDARDVYMVVEGVSLANYVILPWMFWATFSLLTVVGSVLLYLYFFKRNIVKHARMILNDYVVNDIVGGVVSDKKNSEYTGFVGLFRHSRFYWICVTTVVTLCYGFMLTNRTIVIDDALFESTFESHGILIAAGRWGYVPLLSIFNTYSLLPFWRAFIGLIFMVIGITLICGLLRRYSGGRFDDKASAIFASTAVSFPWIANLFIFTAATVEVGLIFLLTSLSIYFAAKWFIENRSFLYFIPAVLILGYSTAFYEITIMLFLMSGFSLLFIHYLVNKEDKEFTGLIVRSLKLMAVVVAGLLFWWGGAVFFQHIFDIEHLYYVDGFVTHNRTTVFSLIRSIISFTLLFFNQRVLRPFAGSEIDTIIWIAAVVLVIIGLIFTLAKKKPTLLLLSIAIALSAFSMHFIIGTLFPPYRMILTFFFLIAFVSSLLYLVIKNIEISKGRFNLKFKYLAILLVVWVVFFQSREMNNTFHLDYQRYQRDVMIMHSIIQEIGLSEERPVLFIGHVPNPLVAMEFAGLSIFDVSRDTPYYELYTSWIHVFFEAHHFPITRPIHVDTAELQFRIFDMPSWPHDGFVREFDEYVVVRLGPSVWD